MITEIYTIYDSVAQVHNKPFHQTNRNVALRTVSDLANDAQNETSKNPNHYSMFYLGKYDDSNGTFELLPAAEHVVNFHELIKA